MYQLECNNCSCASAKPNVFSHVTLLLDKRRISRLSSRDNGASRCLHVKQISCPHTSLHTLLIERAPPQREHGIRWRHPCDPLCLPIPRSHSMHIGRRLPLCSPRIGLGPPPPPMLVAARASAPPLSNVPLAHPVPLPLPNAPLARPVPLPLPDAPLARLVPLPLPEWRYFQRGFIAQLD
jgi:hypothetical protein